MSAPIDQALLTAIGANLAQARLASGRSIDEIAAQTRIHRRYIEAIERGDLAALPPGPYAPSFIKEFGKAVGIKDPFNPGTIADAPEKAEPRSAVSRIPDFAAKATKETAKFANVAAKTAVKTTGQVIKTVGSGTKETLGVITSKDLWDDAEKVRRERLGLEPFPEDRPQAPTDPVYIEEEEAPPMRRVEHKAHEYDEDLDFSSTREGGRMGGKSATWVVIVLLLLVFGGVVYYAMKYNNKDRASLENVRNEELLGTDIEDEPKAEEPKPVEDRPKVDTPVTAPVVTSDSLKFVVRATDSVWISVVPDGALPTSAEAFRGTLTPGSTREFTASDKFSINIGNQKAITMMFNGRPLSNLPTIENSGVVVRDLILTRDRVTLGGTNVPDAPVPGGGVTPQPNTTIKPKPTATDLKANPSSTTTSTTVAKKPASSTTAVAKTPAKKTTKSTTPKKVPTIEPVKPVLPSP